MFDLLVKEATIVDGGGGAPFHGSVAVAGGRIVQIGDVSGPARAVVDAAGLVAAPGIIDIHTHYDAQLCWDPYATPSCLHGITTVVGGNCGFGLAPVGAGDRDYMARLLSRVEGMPLAALQAGVPWDWESFAGYLDRFDGRLGVNAGFLVGHTAIRRSVLGGLGERPATPAETAAMAGLLRGALTAGGLGFSTSISNTHNDADGRPVSSRFADRDEMLELCRVVGELPGTTLELVPPPGRFSEAHVELMTSMSLAADRPLNWNLLNVATAIAEDIGQRLGASDAAAAKGACVIGLVLPGTSAMRLNFTSGFLIDALPVFNQLFELPVPQRLRVLASPEARTLLRQAEHSPEAAALYYLVDWGGLTIAETVAPSNAGLVGRTVADVAAERGIDPFDALCDVVVADELATVLVTPVRGDDPASWALRRRVVRDARTIPGGSDSGAHLDMLDTFAMATRLFGNVVRERQLLPLAEAVQLMTAAPAALYGIRDRGRLVVGAHADLFIFDADRIGAGPVHTRHDLPAGAGRLYADATGVHSVFVNGCEVVHGGELTGALPGTVLRSGRDTRTVTAAEALRGDWRRGAVSPPGAGGRPVRAAEGS